jgi:hypothetical protein
VTLEGPLVGGGLQHLTAGVGVWRDRGENVDGLERWSWRRGVIVTFRLSQEWPLRIERVSWGADREFAEMDMSSSVMFDRRQSYELRLPFASPQQVEAFRSSPTVSLTASVDQSRVIQDLRRYTEVHTVEAGPEPAAFDLGETGVKLRWTLDRSKPAKPDLQVDFEGMPSSDVIFWAHVDNLEAERLHAVNGEGRLPSPGDPVPTSRWLLIVDPDGGEVTHVSRHHRNAVPGETRRRAAYRLREDPAADRITVKYAVMRFPEIRLTGIPVGR